VSPLPIANTDCRMTERSTSDSLATFLCLESCFTALQKECATPPHVQIHDSVLPGLPRVSTASNQHWGKKAGYEARLAPPPFIYRAHCMPPLYSRLPTSCKLLYKTHYLSAHCLHTLHSPQLEPASTVLDVKKLFAKQSKFLTSFT